MKAFIRPPLDSLEDTGRQHARSTHDDEIKEKSRVFRRTVRGLSQRCAMAVQTYKQSKNSYCLELNSPAKGYEITLPSRPATS